MSELKRRSESFKLKYEKFLTGCDAIEELQLWNKEEYGEMDAFYSADLACIITRLICADGRVAQPEVAYINEFFGFTYTAEELQELYADCGDGIDAVFDTGVANGLSLMAGINDKLAAAYKELILLICDIVMESDGVIAGAETALAEKLKSLVG